MKSLLIVVNEEYLSKGITLALLDYFQSIHTTKNPFEALKLLKTEKIDIVISDLNFSTIESQEYINELITYSKFLKSLILFADSSLSIDDIGSLQNLFILKKPISIANLINCINSLDKNLHNHKNGE